MGKPRNKEAVERKPPVRKRDDLRFSPLKSRRAFEEISAEIKGMIFSGVVKPGDTLPSETQLAAQFGVSRQPVREALRRLELAGFIVVQQGASGGPVVTDTILQSISNLFLDAFQLKKLTTNDLTKARLDIERMILRNLFEVHDRGAIARMGEAVRETRARLEQGLRPFEDNLRFHRLMAEATKNYVHVILMESMMTVVAHFHSVLRIGIKTISTAHMGHERILHAIEQGDEPRAQEELMKHILEVNETYRHLNKRSKA